MRAGSPFSLSHAALAALVCVCLSLPHLACSGSSVAAPWPAFAAPPRTGGSGVRSVALRTLRACPGLRVGRAGVALASMREEGGAEKLLWSRRLGEWAEGLAEEGQKLLWSRRLALQLHQAFAGGKGGVAAEAAASEHELAAEPLGAEPERADTFECASCPDQQTCAVAEKQALGEQASLEQMEVPFASPSAQGGKQEWGEIMDLGSSPSRPDLPQLSAADEAKLLAGERVQMQRRNGRVGTGMVVVDVQADISTVFAVLTDLERYPERISTVRRCTIYERGNKVCKAQFNLSRFMLEVNTVLRCERDQNTLRFELDKDRKPLAMEEAKGFWYLEEVPGLRGRTRIWLSAGITCSKLLPTFLVDYAAARALPRATTWLQPTIKAIASQLPPGAGNVRGAVASREVASRP